MMMVEKRERWVVAEAAEHRANDGMHVWHPHRVSDSCCDRTKKQEMEIGR
jgi:hypothetical protein